MYLGLPAKLSQHRSSTFLADNFRPSPITSIKLLKVSLKTSVSKDKRNEEVKSKLPPS